MFRWFARGSAKELSSAQCSTGEVFPPRLHQFVSIEEWFRHWVLFRMSQSVPAQLPIGPGLYLAGSIGSDEAVMPDGQFWINWYDPAIDSQVENWRPAAPGERMSTIVSAQVRRFPELAALLPCRPSTARDCDDCNGTGFLYENFVWCTTCHCLGWLESDG